MWCFYLQAVPRSKQDQILEASLENTSEQLAAQFCTTLGDGDERYVLLRASHTCDSHTITVKARTLPQSSMYLLWNSIMHLTCILSVFHKDIRHSFIIYGCCCCHDFCCLACRVQSVEHLLSALEGFGVDNARIEIEGGPEVPIVDGSALGWAIDLHQVWPGFTLAYTLCIHTSALCGGSTRHGPEISSLLVAYGAPHRQDSSNLAQICIFAQICCYG